MAGNPSFFICKNNSHSQRRCQGQNYIAIPNSIDRDPSIEETNRPDNATTKTKGKKRTDEDTARNEDQFIPVRLGPGQVQESILGINETSSLITLSL